MTKVKTDKKLLTALASAATHKPTAQELQKQRVSYIMGTLKERSNVTRAKVSDVLAAQEGKKSS